MRMLNKCGLARCEEALAIFMDGLNSISLPQQLQQQQQHQLPLTQHDSSLHHSFSLHGYCENDNGCGELKWLM